MPRSARGLGRRGHVPGDSPLPEEALGLEETAPRPLEQEPPDAAFTLIDSVGPAAGVSPVGRSPASRPRADHPAPERGPRSSVSCSRFCRPGWAVGPGSPCPTLSASQSDMRAGPLPTPRAPSLGPGGTPGSDARFPRGWFRPDQPCAAAPTRTGVSLSPGADSLNLFLLSFYRYVCPRCSRTPRRFFSDPSPGRSRCSRTWAKRRDFAAPQRPGPAGGAGGSDRSGVRRDAGLKDPPSPVSQRRRRPLLGGLQAKLHRACGERAVGPGVWGPVGAGEGAGAERGGRSDRQTDT